MPTATCYSCCVVVNNSRSFSVCDLSFPRSDRAVMSQSHSMKSFCVGCYRLICGGLHTHVRMCIDCNGIVDARISGHIGIVEPRGERNVLRCASCHSHRQENYDDCEDDDGSIIKPYSYDATHLLKHPLKKNIVYSGLEIELGVSSRKEEKASQVISLLGKDYAICKNDGSIQGFEVVTIPATLREHSARLKKLCENRPSGLHAWSDSSCGIHIHLSKAPIPASTLVKMQYFVNNSWNKNFMIGLAGRESTRYAPYIDPGLFGFKQYYRGDRHSKRYGDLVKLEHYKNKKLERPRRSFIVRNNETRYSAINLRKANTVEFRIFRSSLKYERIMGYLEFCYALVNFCNEAPLRKGDLTNSKFKTYACQSEYTNLKKLLNKENGNEE